MDRTVHPTVALMSVDRKILRGEVLEHEDVGRTRQLRSLVALLALYACVLLFVILFVSDGANIGSILVAIGGHALYASAKEVLAWREASCLEAARIRMLRRRLA